MATPEPPPAGPATAVATKEEQKEEQKDPDPGATRGVGGIGGGTGRPSVIAVVTRKVLSMVLEELREDDMRRYVAENVIVPLLKVIMAELMPYAVIFSVIIAALLLMSALSLTLLAIFFFKPKNMRL